VNFTVVESVGGKGATAQISKVSISGSSGVTMSGPSSVTVFGQSTFTLLLNTTNVLYANVSVPGVGTATGSATFGPSNYVIGYDYFTSSSTGATSGNSTGASHSTCTTSSCPYYLYLAVKDSYTTAMFGPASLTFSGYVNVTCTRSGGGCGIGTQSYHITTKTPGTVFANATAIINAVANANSTATTWKPLGSATGNVFSATLTLTITSGATTVGYIFDVAKFTLS
jgi:hypothetical protein